MGSMMKVLRSYQEAAINELWLAFQNGERPVLAAPTGAGKTLIASDVFNSARRLNLRVAFVVPFLSLIDQTWDAFSNAGMDESDFSIIQADSPHQNYSKPIKICSADTLVRRKQLPEVDIVIFDECFHPDHELCTEDGWKPISQINEGDKVMAFDPNTDSCQFETVERTVKNLFDGNLIETKGKAFLTLTTPGHEQSVKYGDNIKRVRIDEMEIKYNMSLPVSGNIKEGEGLSPIERLMIAYQADGTHIYTSKKTGINTYRFAFRRQRKIERLEWLLKECGIEYKKFENYRGDINITFQVNFELGKGFDWFNPYISKTKNEEFLEELTQWDGWKNEEGCHWEHPNASTIDKIQIAATLCGYSASFFNLEKGSTASGKKRKNQIRLRWKINKTWRNTIPSFENVKYEGNVYCVTVKSGNVLTRYKGIVSISGNCHRQSKLYSRWMRECPNVKFAGLSATPWARGMRDIWDRLIIVSTTRELIEQKFLCDYKYYAPTSPDLSGVSIVAGDYHEGQLGDAMNKPHLVADLIKTWKEKASDRPTLCFCVTREHAREVQSQFLENGVAAGYCDAYTSVKDRKALIEQLRTGELKVVTNIGTMTTGLDAPFLSCIILARPTKSEMLFLQIVGRGLRTHASKEHLLVLDHSDTGLNLGLPCAIHHTDLLPGKISKEAKAAAKEAAKEKSNKPHKCISCNHVHDRNLMVCPSCGHIRKRVSDVVMREGYLSELSKDGSQKAILNVDMAIRQDWYSGLLYIAIERGYKSGWAAVKWKEKFKSWPDGYSKIAKPPSMSVRSWVRSRNIAYAKAKQKNDNLGV